MNLCTALLIGKNPKHIADLVKHCCKNKSLGTLYVKVVSELNSDCTNMNMNSNVNRSLFHRGIVDCYRSVEAVSVDIRILLTNYRDTVWLKVKTSKSIEVVYYDPSFSSSAIENFVRQNICNKSQNCQIISCLAVENQFDLNLSSEIDEDEPVCYNSVVLGGTFDKLHVGHKLLFSEAIIRCRRQLTVGVVCDQMLQNKLLCEFIDDCATRMKIVSEFLKDVEPTLSYDIMEINDIYGPTKTDSFFEMIVVSSETKKGADKINEYRKSVDLNELDIVEIDVINCDREFSYDDIKISSSNIRMRLLGSLIKPPCLRHDLPRKPYIIGLTGGIASGKSSILNYLKQLGCGSVNCDELGHHVYKVGSTGYEFIKETFGSVVLNEDGTVNRKQLGSIVFNNQEKLTQLNEGLWPLILGKAKQEITKLQNKDIVVIEAALLIQAGWIRQCHEIWTCIIPREEALKRLQKRSNLSIEEARTRVNAHLCNKDYVAHSNVVFCSFWDPSFTKKQVEKAWNDLQKRQLLTSGSCN